MAFTRSEIFNRSQLLLGEAMMDALNDIRVVVFGIGGVGSWTAESLVRTGLRHLTMVDADNVAVSNINRQAPATVCTVGESKVEAMRAHLLEINPEAEITAIHKIFTAETAHEFNFEEYDYVIDAIDSLADKALLINTVTRAHRPRLFSSMGAALKLDPTRIRTAEFWNVNGCRLAAALRSRFKRSGMMPARKFQCVFSDELLPNLGSHMSSDNAMSYNKVATNGSLCHITAIFGHTLTGLLLTHLYKKLK